MKKRMKNYLAAAGIFIGVGLCIAGCAKNAERGQSPFNGENAEEGQSPFNGENAEEGQSPFNGENVKEGQVPLETENGEDEKQPVDLMIFAGQSNMAGNGDAQQAPAVAEGHGYEFRAVSDPAKLYPIEEPFGIEENREDGIYDIWPDSGTRRKLGGLVPAFINGYYEVTGVPVVAVSASEGATVIDQWLPGTGRYEDMTARCRSAKEFLETSDEFELRHTYLVWCQGESDGDAGITEQAYYEAMEELVTALVS